MGLDDFCSTGLVLGLGFSSSSAKKPAPAKNLDYIAKTTADPSLTLSLSGETYHLIKKADSDNNKGGGYDHHSAGADLYRQDSAASSFSNVSVKREREIGSEEVEIERVSSRASDEDDDGLNGRKKLRLTKAQSALLEESFKQHSTLNPVRNFSLSLEFLPT